MSGGDDEARGEILICQSGEGETSNVSFYHPDMIISLGYRIKSRRATQFQPLQIQA